MKTLHIFILIIIFFLMNSYSDSKLSVNTYVNKPIIATNENVELIIEISYETNSNIKIKDIPIPKSENIIPCGQKFISEKKNENGVIFTSIKYCFSFKPESAGSSIIKPIKIIYTENNIEKKYLTKAINIKINSISNNFEIIIIISIILIIVIIITAFIFFKKHKPIIKEENNNKKIIEEQLIICQQNLTSGEIKTFYASVINTIKKVCELYYKIDISKKTIPEIINIIHSNNKISIENKEKLISLLEKSDIIKYSAAPTDFSENNDTLKKLKKCLNSMEEI